MTTLSPNTSLSANIFRTRSRIRLADRQRLFGHAALTLWLTGLSGAGKSTIAYALEDRLVHAGMSSTVLDGDNLRHGLNRDLGFSAVDRRENIRRMAEVARLMNEAGMIVVCACISPFRSDREMAREIIGEPYFAEIYVSTALNVCEARDCKGLYAKARAGQVAHFTGISAPYEPPSHPALALDAGSLRLEESVSSLFGLVLSCCGPASREEGAEHDYFI
ncbi:adenylyl-sulfate kinase [Chromobacterium amazonense]|uniref:adenylyl-sulfate kinase n=1 Tax=Chromobacterium amazonense TaxID=1382803 RepID=UPI003F78F3A0